MILRSSDLVELKHNDPRYPRTVLSALGDRAPTTITVFGDLSILEARKLSLFCSVKCPGRLIVQASDLAHQLAELDVMIVSGFHSPVERECLNILLRGKGTIGICPARSMAGMRISPDIGVALSAGRAILLSLFSKVERRATIQASVRRNEFVAALGDLVLVINAVPYGRIERLCQYVSTLKKPLYVLDDPTNSRLLSWGAKPTKANTGLFSAVPAWDS